MSKFCKSRPYFEGAALSRKANRKSQKLLLFVKMVGNHDDVPMHVKMGLVVKQKVVYRNSNQHNTVELQWLEH